MLDILLMVVIGGMGTLYGAVIGATHVYSRAELSAGAHGCGLASDRKRRPFRSLPHLLHPDRWLLWLGLLFILPACIFSRPESSASCAGRTRP
jgi:branched-chain amino acid transport system permease protein